MKKLLAFGLGIMMTVGVSTTAVYAYSTSSTHNTEVKCDKEGCKKDKKECSKDDKSKCKEANKGKKACCGDKKA